MGFGSLAWITIRTQARNGAVWALAWAAFFGALYTAGFAGFALLAPAVYFKLVVAGIGALSPSDLPLGAALALQFTSWAWIPAILLVLTLGLLLFPDGRPPSPRWRWVGWYSVAMMLLAVAPLVWLTRPSSTVLVSDHTTSRGTAGQVADTALLLVLLGVVASVAAVIVRYRSSSGVTRHQIRWIALGGSFLGAALILLQLIEGSNASGASVTGYMGIAGEALLILSFAVAITKYRLYDIDVVIRKTVVFGALAVFIAAVYVVIVVGIGQLLGQGSEASFSLSIAATALVALAFQPVRRRVEKWANRLVYGRRATPYEVLASFSHRAAEMDEVELIERIPRLIVDGTGVTEATLWVRDGERFVASGRWPQMDEQRYLELVDETFKDPGADHSL
ncbi:MAG: hypothetical protein ACC658_17560, partial [Acidimicrobiia bacterium]